MQNLAPPLQVHVLELIMTSALAYVQKVWAQRLQLVVDLALRVQQTLSPDVKTKCQTYEASPNLPLPVYGARGLAKHTDLLTFGRKCR